MTNVLVTDGEERSSLAVLRALGRRGHRGYVVGSGSYLLAGGSRYANGEDRVPSPLRDPGGFVEALTRLIPRWGIEVLLPVTDAALLAVLEHRGSFPDVHIPFDDLDHLRRLADKQEVLSAAREIGIGVPAQQVLAAPSDLTPQVEAGLIFPLVLKPARSVVGNTGARLKTGVSYAQGLEELRRRMGQFPLEAYPIMLQQRIVGPGMGIFLLLWDGKIMAQFAHRRLREKPPSGGVSVYRESVPADPALVEKSKALLERFGWQGVAMVEYKLDAASARPYLMEINGRFWGSLQLAIDAGVDFPGLLVSLALGEEPAPVTSYRTGIRSRWWWGDVDQLLTRLRHSDAALSLPPDAPGRLRATLDFLKLWRPGDRSEILRWNDPRPFLRESANWLSRR